MSACRSSRRPCSARTASWTGSTPSSRMPPSSLTSMAAGTPDRALEVSTAALAQNGDIDIIYGINDSSSLGGLQAWKAAGKPMDKLLVVGTGGEGLAFINAMEEEPSSRIAAAMFPEKEGYTTIDAAVQVFQGKQVPPHIVSPTAALVGDDWKKYYDYD